MQSRPDSGLDQVLCTSDGGFSLALTLSPTAFLYPLRIVERFALHPHMNAGFISLGVKRYSPMMPLTGDGVRTIQPWLPSLTLHESYKNRLESVLQGKCNLPTVVLTLRLFLLSRLSSSQMACSALFFRTGSPLFWVRLPMPHFSLLAHRYFNAYGHLATQPDIQAVLHLGDYFYEYAARPGEKPSFSTSFSFFPRSFVTAFLPELAQLLALQLETQTSHTGGFGP